MTTEVAQLIVDHLKNEGFVPRIDEDGDVVFKAEGRTYFVNFERDGDDGLWFFRLVFPNFWSVDDEDERKRMEHAALVATRRIKSAKIFLTDDDTCGSIEVFTSSPQEFVKIVLRSLSALQGAVRLFQAEMDRSEGA